MVKPVDHYTRIREYWREQFLLQDPDALIRQFCLDTDEHALYITYYGKHYRICRQSGTIQAVDDPKKPLAFSTEMAILHLFCYRKPNAALTHSFVPFRDIPGASPYAPAFQRSVDEGLAAPFAGHAVLLKKACEALHGVPCAYGDVGYIIPAFDIMPVMLVFWDRDAEFEAQANLLFDAGITGYIHEETVCCIADDLMNRLAEEAGISPPWDTEKKE